MAKKGILHDYDLHANLEDSAQNQKCVVCDAFPMRFQWSDVSGEAMCTQCGCAYQLKWGGKKRDAENKYPYLNMKEEFIPIAREYWNEMQKFVYYGQMLGPAPGVEAFILWMQKHHPEWI